MITCNLSINMTEFTLPSGGGPAVVSATMSITSQTPNPTPGGAPYFSLTSGDSLSVNVPFGTPVLLAYDLTWSVSGYFVFVGVYFTETPPTGMGIGAFPLVILNQADISASATVLGETFSPDANMTVVDGNYAAAGGLYQYTIGIQNLQTFAVGIYDPIITNDFTDPAP